MTACLSGALYLGAEAGWGRLAPVEMSMADGSDQPQLFARIQTSLQKELKNYQGKWLWQARLSEVLQKVQADRRVRSARVDRVFPNRLRVVIEPQQPVMAWADEVGRLFPVATDASLLPALPLNEVRDMPLLRGKVFKNDLSLREQAIALLGALPESGPLARERVAEISYTQKNGFALMLTQSGIEVRLGVTEIEKKTERIAQVLNYLQDQQLRGRVIDARFAKKVVVRLRNAP
ncbi:MAG: cell division protein FtsQ/DivIB [Bdellovibrionales bacterium]